MGTQEEISEYLQQGYTPKQLIDMGYKKSTVYKVNNTMKSYMTPINPPEWMIENIYPYPLRIMPNIITSMNFTFKNTSNKDLYLYRIGIYVEWMKDNEWLAQEVKDLIKPNQKRRFTFRLSIPQIILGEYEIIFGIEGHYLPINNYADQSNQTYWSEPMVIHVKKPLTGTKVFISHSTKDMQIIRELEKRLDNNGIFPIIAEDYQEPGVELESKFKSKIEEATIFLALLTEESINSKWVIKETEYAYRIGKPIIPLKEESIKIDSSIEWVKFSKNWSPDLIFQTVMKAIQQVKPGTISPIGVVLGIGILAFIASLFYNE